MARISLPTTGRLSSSLRVDPTNPSVVKSLNRLSRPSLLSLVLDWLSDSNQTLCPPLLRSPIEEDEDDEEEDEYEGDLHPPVRYLEQLRELYVDMQGRKGSKREVVDRVLEGDWRDGISLYQLAMVDIQYLYDHSGSLKWSAYRLQPLRTPAHEDDVERRLQHDKTSLLIPRFHPSIFLQNFQNEVLPDVKAHYQFERPKGLPLLLLRIFILDSPYTTSLATSNRSAPGSARGRGPPPTSFDSSRTIYVAFPDASPHLYISKGGLSSGSTTSGETRSLRSLIVDGIPKALSRPNERYVLQPTSLVTKNLDALLHVKGGGRTNSAGGGWGVYAKNDRKSTAADSPLNTMLPTPPLSDVSSAEDGGVKDSSATDLGKRKLHPIQEEHEKTMKRSRLIAQARFGDSGKMNDGKGVERVDILIEDPFAHPATSTEETEEEEYDSAVETLATATARHRRRTTEEAFTKASRGARDEGREEEDAEDAEEEDSTMGSAPSHWKPQVRFTFHGSHVFAGVRQLVEAGIVDGERMPGWLTGEEGVSIGAVRDGRIRGHKGSGL